MTGSESIMPTAEATEEEFGEVRPLTGVSRPTTADVMYEKDLEITSQYLVARVMSATEKRIDRILSASESRVSSAVRPQSALTAYSDADTSDVEDWKLCEELVSGVISTWTLSDRWKHCIKKIGKVEKKLLFEAIFSAPTRRRPIPNATASILFAVDLGRQLQEGGADSGTPDTNEEGVEGKAQHIINRVMSATNKMIDEIVDGPPRPVTAPPLPKPQILFSLEIQDLVHNAKDDSFREQWLHDILAAKRDLFDVANSVLN